MLVIIMFFSLIHAESPKTRFLDFLNISRRGQLNISYKFMLSSTSAMLHSSRFQLLSFCNQFGTDQNIVGNYFKVNSIFNSLYHLISLRFYDNFIPLKITK